MRTHREEMEREQRVEQERDLMEEALDKAAKFVGWRNERSFCQLCRQRRTIGSRTGFCSVPQCLSTIPYHRYVWRMEIFRFRGEWSSARGECIDGIMEEEEKKINKLERPSHLGRTVFVALNVTRWEKDPKVVLEVGWSAIF